MMRIFLLTFCLLAASASNAANVTVDVGTEKYFNFRAGFADIEVLNTPAVSHEQRTVMGQEDGDRRNRGVYAFDLSGIDGTVGSASFSIYLGASGYDSYLGSETLNLFAYEYPPKGFLSNLPDFGFDSLEAAIDEIAGWTGPSVPLTDASVAAAYFMTTPFGDSGITLFSSIEVTSSDQGSYLNMDLNAAGIAAAQASAGGLFAVYLELPGAIDFDWLAENCQSSTGDYRCLYHGLFDAETSGTAQLQLNVVPIPPAVLLFGSALGLLGWQRRRG